MEITLNKSEIYKDVKMNVSILARDLKDASGESLFDKVRIQERDDDFLDLHWNTCFGSLVEGIKEFVKSVSGNTIILSDERRFSTYVAGDLSFVAANYLVSRITSEWLRLKAPEYAASFAENSAFYMKVITEKLRYKSEPSLKKFNG